MPLPGALLTSEVMAQNAALAAHKAQVKQLRAAQEAAFVAQQRRALEVQARPAAARQCQPACHTTH